MIIGFLRENDEFENRSMLLVEHVSLLTKLGFKVLISSEYGKKLNLQDSLFESFGAEVKSENDIAKISDIVVKISGKDLEKFDFKKKSIIITAFFDKNNSEYIKIKLK